LPAYAFNNALRCGAKTRAGTACLSPSVRSKKRCRMHGGAKGSGAPKGSQNAFKHGFYVQTERMIRLRASSIIRLNARLLQALEKCH
jgi:glucans biosynthesis protein